LLAEGELRAPDLDALAALVAAFHADAARCPEGEDYGSPAGMRARVLQNFSQIRAASPPEENLPQLESIETWSIAEHARLRDELAARKRAGRVRECHGDLHLGNIAFLDGKPRLFDCIEFNPALRWIDVFNEVAFLVMDLRAAGHERLARRFLNAYLEASGDYAGLRTLRYFLVYRAMVRAKIFLMRAGQLRAGEPEQARAQAQFGHYLELAQNGGSRAQGFVVITHGLSGSGKTTLSQSLIDLTGAIRIRSDVERKRLMAGAIPALHESAVASGLYAAHVTQATYQRLLELAGEALASGYGVIIDATFLRRAQRDLFRSRAAAAQVPFVIVKFSASEPLLRSRIEARRRLANDASDADLSVLEYQLQTQEPLQADELECAFVYDASRDVQAAELAASWGGLLEFLALRAFDLHQGTLARSQDNSHSYAKR
jgi:predicted kinase